MEVYTPDLWLHLAALAARPGAVVSRGTPQPHHYRYRHPGNDGTLADGAFFLRREKPFREVFRELFRVRRSRWLLLSFVLLPVVVLAHMIHAFLFNGTAPVINNPVGIPLLFLSTLIAGGPLFEEIGWRGYLQGQLLKRHSILVTGLLMGILWGI